MNTANAAAVVSASICFNPSGSALSIVHSIGVTWYSIFAPFAPLSIFAPFAPLVRLLYFRVSVHSQPS